MKVVKQVPPPVEPPFEPIVLTITLETAAEARALYAIFNKVGNTELFSRDPHGTGVRDALGTKYSVGSGSAEVISNGITGAEYFGRK